MKLIQALLTSKWGSFFKYGFIGILNTLIHWAVFYGLYLLNFKQAYANLIAFIIAVTFSFFANAKYTFKTFKSYRRYFEFVLTMGALSFLVGFCGDKFEFNPLITLILFSATSFILGYLISKYLIFKEPKP